MMRYKRTNSSFDDVINDTLDKVDPDETYEKVLEEHHMRLEVMESGEYVTLDELKKKLKVWLHAPHFRDLPGFIKMVPCF